MKFETTRDDALKNWTISENEVVNYNSREILILDDDEKMFRVYLHI